jgi:hypothetical protein
MRCASLLETVTEKSATPVPLAAIKGRQTMKYTCLGYYDKSKHDAMTEAEKQAMFDACFTYDDHLRANGHLVAEVPLQPAETAVTLYWKNGKVATTDGPYAETKEQLGGLQIFEARDLNHAIQLVSQLPGFKYGLGPIEIRPIADITEIIKQSEQRRRKDISR